MFCMHCGQQLPPDAAFCPNCGGKCAGNGASAGNAFASAQPQPAAEEETGSRKVNSSMAFAVVMLILSLLCCNVFTFIPGLIAVLFAFQVPGSVRVGHFAVAARRALIARIFCWIAVAFLAAELFGIAVLIRYSDEIGEYLNEKLELESAEGADDANADPDAPSRHNLDYSLLWDLLD